jgi:hypothetical protein
VAAELRIANADTAAVELQVMALLLGVELKAQVEPAHHLEMDTRAQTELHTRVEIRKMKAVAVAEVSTAVAAEATTQLVAVAQAT